MEQTYGQKAVGLDFNPSNNGFVSTVKQNYAMIIDGLNEMRAATEDTEQKRLIAIAITEAQSACMWAVKAATWK